MSDLFIFAGEPSGDVHGGHLMKALRREVPKLTIAGVGGPQMRAQGMELLLPTESFEVMGFTDVLYALPRLLKQFKQVKIEILKRQPKAVILIDYPGFNLRLAKALRKAGYRGQLVQYISPTVWAHGKKRIETIAKNYNLLLTIYPFEEECYAKSGLKVTYVGNPLVEYVQEHPYEATWAKQLGLPLNGKLLSLFPGSRKGEVMRNLPKLLEVAMQLKREDPDVCIAISCAHEEAFKQMKELAGRNAFLVPKRFTYELMQASRAAIAKSGTVTLELALHRCPTVVIYQLTRLNYFIAKWILRLNLPFYCIVNILAKARVFPELIGRKLIPNEMLKELEAVWRHRREGCLKGCDQVIAQLDHVRPSQEAAKAIVNLIK